MRVGARIKSYAVRFGIAALVVLGFEPAAAQLTSHDLRTFFDAELPAMMTEAHAPGVSIAVVRDGALIFSKGYGISRAGSNSPVDPRRTIFRIGSITKVFTAVTALQLVDEGKIQIDADVNGYLHSVRIPSTQPGPIRLRDLLTHSAGLDDIGHGRKVFERDKVISLSSFLKDRVVRRLPTNTIASYGTYAPTLLGLIVEDVTGTGLRHAFHAKIFAPLGMSRSYTSFPPVSIQAERAIGYEWVDGKWVEQPYEYFHSFPASDIDSTATDMGRFAAALLAPDDTLLSRSFKQAMLSRQFGNHPDVPGWGFGLTETWEGGHPAAEHGGSMMGYSSLLYLLPEKRVGLVILSNSESALGLQLRSKFVQKFFPARSLPVPAVSAREYPPLETFAGRYQMDIYCHSCGKEADDWKPPPLDLTIERGRLTGLGAVWRRIGPTTFEDPKNPARRIAFRIDGKDRVSYLFHELFAFERVPEHPNWGHNRI